MQNAKITFSGQTHLTLEGTMEAVIDNGKTYVLVTSISGGAEAAAGEPEPKKPAAKPGPKLAPAPAAEMPEDTADDVADDTAAAPVAKKAAPAKPAAKPAAPAAAPAKPAAKKPAAKPAPAPEPEPEETAGEMVQIEDTEYEALEVGQEVIAILSSDAGTENEGKQWEATVVGMKAARGLKELQLYIHFAEDGTEDYLREGDAIYWP